MINNALHTLKEFFGLVEEHQDTNEEKKVAQPTQQTPIIKSINASLLNSQNTKRFSSSEIKIEEPRIYEDSLNIATYLRESIPVIVNLKYLDNQAGKRLIDFICGTAYAINGHMMKIGENIFLFTPANVLIVDSGDKTTFEQGLAQEEKEVFFKKAAQAG
jgi:cell division inhibitor SepF